MPRPTPLLRGLLGWLVVLALTTANTGPAVAADEGDPIPDPGSDAPAAPVNDSTVLAANAYPGVQLISTTYKATVRVSIPVINQNAVANLTRRVYTQALTGVIDTTEEAITEVVVDSLVKSPNTYFVPGRQTYSKRDSLVGIGTGWAITPDGYLITAAHVVDTPNRQLRREFASQSLSKLGRQFVRGLQNSETSFTPDQVDRLTDAILGWLAKRIRVDRLRVSVTANLALGLDGLGKNQVPVAAEIVDVGKPYPGNDVALLKIDGQENLPTIPIGDNAGVSPGATVHVVGFPAASTFSAGFSQDSRVQPTVTEGPVTAIKSTDSGMPVLQTQAPASPGNSGGPVLTDEGAAVGVLVATALNNDGTAAQGQAFVIPSSEVFDMLEQNGVVAEESVASAAYAGAVDAFYGERYREALPLFEKVETLYPAHPFAAKFIRDSKTAIEQGRDKTPEPAPDSRGLWPWIIAGLIALALLTALALGVGLWLLRRTRRDPSRSNSAWMTGSYPTPGYPPPPGHQQPIFGPQEGLAAARSSGPGYASGVATIPPPPPPPPGFPTPSSTPIPPTGIDEAESKPSRPKAADPDGAPPAGPERS